MTNLGFIMVLYMKTVRNRRFIKKCRHFQINIDRLSLSSTSSNCLKSVLDVKMRVTRSLNCDFRGHSIITPYLDIDHRNIVREESHRWDHIKKMKPTLSIGPVLNSSLSLSLTHTHPHTPTHTYTHSSNYQSPDVGGLDEK